MTTENKLRLTVAIIIVLFIAIVLILTICLVAKTGGFTTYTNP
jgi:hypothetical protein